GTGRGCVRVLSAFSSFPGCLSRVFLLSCFRDGFLYKAPRKTPMRTTGSAAPESRLGRGAGWLLFLTAFCGYAYFDQGGGWSQNVRFAEVRAVVEERRLAIASYLIYDQPPPDAPSGRLVRLPVEDGRCTYRGQLRALAWPGPDGRPVSIADPPPAGCPL